MKKLSYVAGAVLAAGLALSLVACKEKEEPIVIPEINDSLIKLEGGTFSMGSAEKVKRGYYSHDLHDVTLSSFFVSPYEVTQEDFEAIMGYNTSRFLGEDKWTSVPDEEQSLRPAERMTWFETIVYCNRLSILHGLEPVYSIRESSDFVLDESIEPENIPFVTDPDLWGNPPDDWVPRWCNVEWDKTRNGYRLLTEAEWEYMAIGGFESADAFLAQEGYDVYESAWIKKNSNGQTHQVGLKAPNGYGIYDSIGNVREWLWDWFNADYYGMEGSSVDPSGPKGGDFRCVRGAEWDESAADANPAIRASSSPNIPSIRQGFRIARSDIDYVARAQAEREAAEAAKQAEKEAKKAAKKAK